MAQVPEKSEPGRVVNRKLEVESVLKREQAAY